MEHGIVYEGDTKSEGARQDISRTLLDLRSRLGKALADLHKLSLGRSSDRLLMRLAENEGVLIGVCNLLTAAVKAKRRIPLAGEWFLDNFYLVEEQIRMDWREFVETLSIVEGTLWKDPGGVYGMMDFATRDRYRHVVEEIAKSSPLSESEVAQEAIRLARESAATKHLKEREAHVGFYLIDKGLPQLELAVKRSRSTSEALQKMIGGRPLLLYLGIIALITAVSSGSLLVKAHGGAVQGWNLPLVGVLLLLCTSHLAVALVNWLGTLWAAPRPLPRMNFSRGIPPEYSTLVVVPTMLTSAQNIEDLVEALEVRFLANRDESLYPIT